MHPLSAYIHTCTCMYTGVSCSSKMPTVWVSELPPLLAAFGGGGPHCSPLVRLWSVLPEVWQCGKGVYRPAFQGSDTAVRRVVVISCSQSINSPDLQCWRVPYTTVIKLHVNYEDLYHWWCRGSLLHTYQCWWAGILTYWNRSQQGYIKCTRCFNPYIFVS